MTTDLTDDQRLQLVRELWSLAYATGCSDGFRLLWLFEQQAMARLGRAG
jgi:hypothetical protein